MVTVSANMCLSHLQILTFAIESFIAKTVHCELDLLFEGNNFKSLIYLER